MQRMSTGTAGLDEVLRGGLVANSTTLLVGPPGSGKTILAERCLFTNASEDRPGLYLSTVSEPYDKILRYGQSQSFFDVTKVGSAVFYDDLGAILVEDGLTAVSERISALVKQHRPGVVVIDSFKALKAFAVDEADFRRFLHTLAGRFTALAVSAIWVGEYAAEEASVSAEFAVADSVIVLETKRTSERSTRYLSIAKLRGSDFSAGDHAYRLTGDGMRVFPRLADPAEAAPYVATQDRVTTGVPALDECLEQGYRPGSTTLIVGPTGIGKTLLGLQFLFAGAASNQPGVLLSLQEDRTQLAGIVERFGWSIDHPKLRVMNRSPVDAYVDELVYELLDAIDETGAKRVVVDSFTDLGRVSLDPTRLREFTFSLVQRCARQGVSLMFTHESLELFGISGINDNNVSNMADNVILLQHLPDGTQMKRALSILKARGTAAITGPREFTISRHGIELGGPVDANRLYRA